MVTNTPAFFPPKGFISSIEENEFNTKFIVLALANFSLNHALPKYYHSTFTIGKNMF